MKTIYTTSSYGNHKVIIDDLQEDTIRAAKDRVIALSMERPWKPSIEIDLQQAGRREDGFPVRFAARVYWDDGRDTSGDDRIGRLFQEGEPTAWIRTDVGIYGESGWRSAIDYKDFFELPEVFFEDSIVMKILSPRVYLNEPEEEANFFSLLEDSHHAAFLSSLDSALREALEYTEETPYLTQLKTTCEEMQQGNLYMSDLMALWQKEMQRYRDKDTEGHGSKESEF